MTCSLDDNEGIITMEVTYFPERKDAEVIRDGLLKSWPDSRIVAYERGYAVQYARSGNYYPEAPGRYDFASLHDSGSLCEV